MMLNYAEKILIVINKYLNIIEIINNNKSSFKNIIDTVYFKISRYINIISKYVF